MHTIIHTIINYWYQLVRSYYYSLNLLNGVLLVKVIRLLTYLMFVMNNCFLLCVIGLTIACIICC